MLPGSLESFFQGMRIPFFNSSFSDVLCGAKLHVHAQLICCASALSPSPSLLKPPSFPLRILLHIALLRVASALQQDLWEAHAVTAIERARQRTGTPR
jgi:hypothetical protein